MNLNRKRTISKQHIERIAHHIAQTGASTYNKPKHARGNRAGLSLPLYNSWETEHCVD